LHLINEIKLGNAEKAVCDWFWVFVAKAIGAIAVDVASKKMLVMVRSDRFMVMVYLLF
jgi:hypothetical protein